MAEAYYNGSSDITSPPQNTFGSIRLAPGAHSIRVQRAQFVGRSDLGLSWQRPNASAFEPVPSSVLSHSEAIEVPAHNPQSKPQKLVGYFFKDTNTSDAPVAPIGSKFFDHLNFVDGNKLGDQFGVGLSDNFAARFTGYLRLPPNYPAGEYTIRLMHDDGVLMYLGETQLINKLGGWDFHMTADHTAKVTLEPNKDYPFQIHYDEGGLEAEIRLEWQLPGQPAGTTNFEVIPASAYYH